MNEYRPSPMDSFDVFDNMVESCYVDQSNIIKIIPSTLEGCVVRVSDILAYIGKDRLDAMKSKLSYVDPTLDDEDGRFRTFNARIINNLEVNIIENSYGKPYIKLDEEHYALMSRVKRDNYARIYNTDNVSKVLDERVRPLMQHLRNVIGVINHCIIITLCLFHQGIMLLIKLDIGLAVAMLYDINLKIVDYLRIKGSDSAVLVVKTGINV